MMSKEAIEEQCPELILSDDNEGLCNMCDDPTGLTFFRDPCPVPRPQKWYVCQKCAPVFIAQWKKDHEEFCEAFDEAASHFE